MISMIVFRTRAATTNQLRFRESHMSGLEIASVYVAVNILILIWLACPGRFAHRRKGSISQ